MNVTLLGTPSPIYLIGESHTLIFRNRLFRANVHQREQLYMTRTRYLPHVLAQNFCNPSVRAYHQDLLDALRAEELLRADLTPAHYSLDGATISGAWMEQRAILAPAMVLCIGDLDLHHLLNQFVGYDFELPDTPIYATDYTLQPVAYSTVLAQLEKLLLPFTEGMRHLQAFGFSRMLVHCIPPRSADEAATARWTKVPKAVRAKLTVLANQILARACADIGLPFIDTWDILCEHGYLRTEFDLDGTHLTLAAAQISLERIVTLLHQHTWNAQNVVRYQHAQNQAERHGYAAMATSDSVASGQLSLSPTTAATLLGTDHDYQPIAAENTRPDWAAPTAPNGLRAATPGDGQLEAALTLLQTDAAQTLLHAGIDYALTCSNYRTVRLDAGQAACTLATLRQSCGIRKAWLRLEGSGQLHLHSSSGTPLHTLDAAVGSMVLYDPAAAVCTLEAGTTGLTLLELTLIPRAVQQPFRVISSAQYQFPLDPFQYSVENMAAVPPFEGSQVCLRAITMQ
ncbi:SGNH/GDSL hydrolase family protein [Pseudoduganella danionis]|uniref:SGNH/GDSL hydrolase family protein n=1 Tax=Pseudoduganella danionis TaxID=1890295 RepID=A0ABW9STC4_9BURK|nr:SGNH/GDSL hydrolase family protein [Pseudoduganella danionis]MTW33987.1 hypothetical protein [Pseudoduganella danionis]